MEFIGITLTGWSAIVVILSMSVLTGMMFMLGRERMHYVWGIFCTAVTIWIGGFYGATVSYSPEVALTWWKISYIGVILLPFTFYHFILEFIGVTHSKKFSVMLLYGVAAVFVVLDVSTNWIVDGVKFLFGELYYGQPGFLHPYFMILYVVLISCSFYLVIKKYRERKDDALFRQRVIYFFIANLIAFTGGSLNFLPIYEIDVPPITNISVAFGVALLTYAILRYRLFNARVVTAQLLTLILAGFALFHLIVSASVQEMVFNVLLLAITLLVGVYLILSVRKEVEQRERLEVLSSELAAANEELKKLDAAKSEFISIAGHQLRAPLTVIKGYVSMAEEGTFGAISGELRDALSKVFYSAEQLVKLVASLLDLSRMESGRIKYEFVMSDFHALVKKVLEEFTLHAEKKGLRLAFENRAGTLPQFVFDPDKMREVVVNLVDNAIKYSKEGEVAVRCEVSATGGAPHLRLSVQDSGIGIKKEDIGKLFSKFGRTEQAQLADPNGMGIGLYFVKRVVEDHGGRVWVESSGIGKGSTFFVELPIKTS